MINRSVKRALNVLADLEAAAQAEGVDVNRLVQVYCAERMVDSLDSMGSDLAHIETALSAG